MIKSHFSGDSIFVDDMSRLENEVLVGLVGAPCAAGRINKIDLSDALKVPGVVAGFTTSDFSEKYWGALRRDQPYLVVDEIGYKHEPVCAIAASSAEALAEGKKRVRIGVEKKPALLSVEEAHERGVRLYQGKTFARGDIDAALERAAYRHRGRLKIGGQEHFYLEPQSTLVVPVDGDCLKVYSATQHPTETQQDCALATGLGFHQVSCEVRRLGGGFGGKETQASHFAAIAAVVAHRLQRPARLVLGRDDDFWMTGKRHPFVVEYDVGYDENGRLDAVKMYLIADGGAYTDLSPSIFDRALYHADGAYYLPVVHVTGCVVKTNTASNTAMRGFGGPQGNLAIENILEEVAQRRGLDAAAVRRINLYPDDASALTPYGQPVENNQLHRLYERVMEVSNYAERRRRAEAWNKGASKDGHATLRGVALSFTKFGISFTSKFLNQANSLVHLQTDGSAQVSTGAVEMGQGVQVKMASVVAREFGLPLDRVQVLATSTERNANTSPTAASSGADMNGMATLIACRSIKQKLLILLENYRRTGVWQEIEREIEQEEDHEMATGWEFAGGKVKHGQANLELTLAEVCRQARFCRVSLSGYGHYKTPELEKNPFYYFTQGACVSEVEVDTMTGMVKILSSHVVMDLGTPLDEKIDRGQIAGAFLQGVGWMIMEELFYDDEGELMTHSPSTYKVPLMSDMPEEWTIELIANPEFSKNIYKSKAVGEPPLLLSASVWLAVKQALAARKSDGELVVPATPQNVLAVLQAWKG